MTRLEQQVQFIREIDKVKNIYRQTYLADGRRKENDAEHSWHIALMAVLLQEYVPDADAARVMTMVLIHDLVEIDAGDTYAYDSAGAETKRVREAYSGFFRWNKGRSSAGCGRNLRSMRHRMRSLPICWIISSHCCSMMHPAGKAGLSIR